MGNENQHDPQEVLLPDDAAVRDAIEGTAGDIGLLRAAVSAHPGSALAWATLADAVYDPARPLDSYAFARVGHDLALTALTAAGWSAPARVPWSALGNRGVLRALHAYARAAEAIGEAAEAERAVALLRTLSPESRDAIATASSAWVPRHHSVTPPTEAIVIRGVD